MYGKKIHCEFDFLFKQTILQVLQPTFMGYRLLNKEK